MSREQFVYRTWGKRIRNARKARGLNQETFAAALGVSQSSVSEWENGKRGPSDDLKFRICDLLQQPIDQLFAWPEYVPSEPGSRKRGQQ